MRPGDKELILFDPNKYIFLPRPDIKPEFGNQEHIDLLRPFTSNVHDPKRNVSLNLSPPIYGGIITNEFCLHKDAIRRLIYKLKLKNLNITLDFSNFSGPGGGRVWELGDGTYAIYLACIADDEIAKKFKIPTNLWEAMDTFGGDFTKAELITINHTFFHEMFHIKCFSTNTNTPDGERDAEIFALKRTARIISGNANIAPIWPLKALELQQNTTFSS